MRIYLSGNAASWQEALEPFLERLRGFFWHCLSSKRDVEELVQDAMCWTCLDASKHWQPGEGLDLCATYAVRAVRSGRRSSGVGLGYSHRARSVRARRMKAWMKDAVRGRFVSPPDAASFREMMAAVPKDLQPVCVKLVGGMPFQAAARLAGLDDGVLYRKLRLCLSAWTTK